MLESWNRHEGWQEKLAKLENVLRKVLTYVEPRRTGAVAVIPSGKDFYDVVLFSGKSGVPMKQYESVRKESIAQKIKEINMADASVFLSLEEPGERRRLRLVNNDLTPRFIERGYHGNSQIVVEY